jgi:hypothetical protein
VLVGLEALQEIAPEMRQSALSLAGCSLAVGVLWGFVVGTRRPRPSDATHALPGPSAAPARRENAQVTQIRALFVRLNRPDLDAPVKRLLVDAESRILDGLERLEELEASRNLERSLGESSDRLARLAAIRDRAERDVNALIDHVRDLHIETLARNDGSSAIISARLRDALNRMAADTEVAEAAAPRR